MAMAYRGADTAGTIGDSLDASDRELGLPPKNPPKGPMAMGRQLFKSKKPGSPGKLGKASTKSESLSKLRGKGALP